MITDIEWLHDVVDGKKKGRHVGKTFAKCHEVAGLIGLDFKEIYCIVLYHKDIFSIIPMLVGILDEHELPNLTKNPREPHSYTIGDVKLHFICDNDLYTYNRDYPTDDDYAVVNMMEGDDYRMRNCG